MWLWAAGLCLSGGALAQPPAGGRGAASPTAAWADPSYGPWHSCVVGGGGYLIDTVICPSDPQRMYVYGDMDGLFRSDDAGNTWRMIHGGMDVQQGHYGFAGLIADPRDPDEIAVASGDQFGPRQGVFLSGDGGRTWTKTLSVRFMGNGPFRWAGARIAGDCGKTGRVVAATEGSGVWRSRDGGRTWQDCGLRGVFFTDVHIDRTDPDRIWLCAEPVQLDGGEFRQLSGGMYRSEDGGKRWTKLSDESPFEIAQDPVKANVLYGLCDRTVKRSTDFGTTWQDFEGGLPVGPNTPDGADPFRAVGAGPDFVVIVSSDTKREYRLTSGQSRWQAVTPTFSRTGWRFGFVPPPANDASSITVSPRNRDHWYLTDEFGVYQTWDAGHVWTPSDRGIETTVIHTLTPDPANPARVYLGAGDIGFWWSDDAGTVLTQTDSSSAGWVGNIKCVAASSASPSRVYAVGGEGWNSDRVYLSTDGGRSVSLLPMRGVGLPAGPFSCDSIVADPRDPNSVYLATSTVIGPASGGVYHSADGGTSWAWAGQGLPPGRTVFQSNIWWGGPELAMGPDGTLLAVSASANGAFRFDTASAAWTALDLPHAGGLYSVVADPRTPGRFYVCVVGDDTQPGNTDGGLFRTDDAGATWKKVLAGSVHAVTCDPAVTDRVAASTVRGVFLSADGGGTWATLPPMPNRWVNEALAFAGSRVLAGTGGNGAFWMDLGGVSRLQKSGKKKSPGEPQGQRSGGMKPPSARSSVLQTQAVQKRRASQ